MATKLTDMGIKRKEMHGEVSAATPKSEKDYENEKAYPELRLSGAHAEMMGAEDLKTGDVVQQTVRWRVKDRVKREVDGKDPEYEMTLCIEKAGDHAECADDSEKPASKSDAGEDSPAMAYIQGRAKSAE